MKLKKLLALMLAVVMAAAMLTACGTTDTADTADTAATESDWQYISDKGEMIIGITLFAPMNLSLIHI